MANSRHARQAQSSRAADDSPDMPVFFYMPQEKPYGVFCQWHTSKFSIHDPQQHFAYLVTAVKELRSDDTAISDILSNEGNTVDFVCAEQYMMFAKAIFFGDANSARRIMATTDPKEQKKIGRLVKSFSNYEWAIVRERVAEEGNVAKFSSDPALKSTLTGTGDRELCEASSKDRIWGIGFKEAAARKMVAQGIREKRAWGENLLGKALMRARTRLITASEPAIDEV